MAVQGDRLPEDIKRKLEGAISANPEDDVLFLADADRDNAQGSIVVKECNDSNNVFLYV